jgi:O-antigen/teichoic acid export membrane protein
MLQMMGQSEYGLTGTASSFISYLSILSFGIGGAYIRFNTRYRVANDREGEKQLNGMFLTVFSFLSILVFVCGCGCILGVEKLVEQSFTPQELYKLQIILFILTVNTMITFIMNVVMMALQAYEKFIAIRVVSLIAAVATPILNIIALKTGGKAVAITLISLAVSIGCYIFYFIYAKQAIKMAFSFRGFQKDVLKEIFVFSGFLFLNSMLKMPENNLSALITQKLRWNGLTSLWRAVPT